MSTFQPAPAPDRQYSNSVTTSDSKSVTTSGSAAPPAPPENRLGSLEMQLNNDARLKTALHRLVLILPLTILIFAEALRHQDKTIKLPMLELEIELRLVIPIFLLIISYMLYRALRYSRIVLYDLVYLPERTTKVAQIVLDNTEMYKMNSAYYEEVLDPTAAELVDLKNNKINSISRNTFAALNLIKSLIVYSFIFLMLAFMIFYVSRELVPAIKTLKADIVTLRWLSEPTWAIDALVLGLSALLLALGWANALLIVLLAFLMIIAISCLGLITFYFLLLKAIRLLYATPLLAPLRMVFGALFRLATRIREKNRDKVFASEEAAYAARMESYIATKPNTDEFLLRFKLFRAADNLAGRNRVIADYFGDEILEGDMIVDGKFNKKYYTSEQYIVRTRYGFTDLYGCTSYLKVFAHLGSLDFVSSNGWQIQEQLKQIVDSYDVLPDNRLLAALQKQKKKALRPEERRKAAVLVRQRLNTVSPRNDEIDELEKKCKRELTNIITNDDERDISRLRDAAEKYFMNSDCPSTSFPKDPPVRGARDWIIVTRLLIALQRLAGLTPTVSE
jgi:hypothetical protein